MSAATIENETDTDAKLSLGDVAKVDELRKLGWTIDTKVKPFKAFEKASDLREVGPAASIKAIHTQVMLAVGKPVEGKTVPVGKTNLEAGEFKNDSQPILTGTEDAVFADLQEMGKEYRLNTMEILRRQKIQATQKESCEKMMAKFQDELEVDTEGDPYFVVEIDGEEYDIVLASEEKQALKTRKHGKA